MVIATEKAMDIPTRLTIQDYFKHRNRICSHSIRGGKVAVNAVPDRGDDSFSKTLDRAQAVSAGRTRGLSIQDYLQRRIASHINAAVGKASCAALRRSPAAPPVAETAADQQTVPETMPQQKKIPLLEKVSQKGEPIQVRQKILASIDQAAAQFRLPAALIKAVVKAESNYQVRALSPAGAQGLMQLMPATARELGVTDPFDIDQNIRGGAQYLRNMLDQFNGDIHLALSAYNAGPGTVAKYSGNVPYAETRTYVQRVLRYAEEFSSPEVT
jgi:soluble lytic murein transglycosylase-like protein